MSLLHSIASDRVASGIAFAAMVVFTVLWLEGLRIYAEQTKDSLRVRAISTVLALVFLVMAIGGAADFAVTHTLGLVNLGAFLTGTTGLGIVVDFIFRGARERELQRMLADDL